MKKSSFIIVFLATMALSCGRSISDNEKLPNVVEGEVLNTETIRDSSSTKYIVWIDFKEDGNRSATNKIEVTPTVIDTFTRNNGDRPFFARLKKNYWGQYSLQEVALANYDAVGMPPFYMFSSDKKMISN